MKSQGDNEPLLGACRCALFPLITSLAVLANVAVVVCGSSHAGVAIQYWFDDFNDGNATEGDPVTWSPNFDTFAVQYAPEGRVWLGDYDPTSGDYLIGGKNLQGDVGLFDNDSEIMLASVETAVFINGASIRTRGHVNENEETTPRQLGGLGMFINMTTFTATGYIGTVGNEVFNDPNDPNNPNNGQVRGAVEFGAVVAGSGNDNVNFAVEDLEPFLGDVIFQADFFENDDGDRELSISYWVEGSLQPDTPQGVINLDAIPPELADLYAFGVTGLGFGEQEIDPNGNGSGIFRWAKAAAVRLINGDMDLDGDHDFDDIPGFVKGLTDKDAYEAEFGLSSVMMGDTDDDGDHDFDDIPGFVAILSGGGGLDSGARGIPEPSTAVLAALGLLGIGLFRRRRH